MMTRLAAAIPALAIAMFAHPPATSPDDAPATSVGMMGRIDGLVLPGSELEVAPVEVGAPVVLRIAGVFPHGTAHRYDLVYYGLEPGQYDLRDLVRRRDGTSAADLPEIPIRVTGLLKPGQIEPHALRSRATAYRGWYRAALVAGAVIWVLGLAAILLAGRRRAVRRAMARQRPVSLAAALRPMVRKAIDGALSAAERAELERLLVEYWRRRLKLDGLPAAVAIGRLRDDAEAGVLLRQLEQWLHRPPGTAAPEVDIESLLEPYRQARDVEHAAAAAAGES